MVFTVQLSQTACDPGALRDGLHADVSKIGAMPYRQAPGRCQAWRIEMLQINKEQLVFRQSGGPARDISRFRVPQEIRLNDVSVT